jgi:hypothetical protein
MKKEKKLKIKNIRMMSQTIQTGGAVTVEGCSRCRRLPGTDLWMCDDCVPLPV